MLFECLEDTNSASRRAAANSKGRRSRVCLSTGSVHLSGNEESAVDEGLTCMGGRILMSEGLSGRRMSGAAYNIGKKHATILISASICRTALADPYIPQRSESREASAIKSSEPSEMCRNFARPLIQGTIELCNPTLIRSSHAVHLSQCGPHDARQAHQAQDSAQIRRFLLWGCFARLLDVTASSLAPLVQRLIRY